MVNFQSGPTCVRKGWVVDYKNAHTNTKRHVQNRMASQGLTCGRIKDVCTSHALATSINTCLTTAKSLSTSTIQFDTANRHADLPSQRVPLT
jgi:hypothetical protein